MKTVYFKIMSSITLLLFCIFNCMAGNVLIYGPMLSPSPNEQTLAVAAGHTVTVVTAAQWNTMTTAQFASYDVIIIPDNACRGSGGNSDSNLMILNANKSIWSPAVTGRICLIGADYLLHRDGQYQEIITNTINFIADGSGTGLFFSASCTFYNNYNVPINFLSNVISVNSVGSNCPSPYAIVEPSHPIMSGITNSGVGSGCTSHCQFGGYPGSLNAIALAANGFPFIVASSNQCLAPIITCPSDFTVDNDTGQCGANVSFTGTNEATATGTSPTITYSLDSGSFFAVGTTLVTATATNDCGTDSCTFNVTVNDNEKPIITCPGNQTLNTITNTCAANYTIADPIADNCTAAIWGYALSGATTGTVSGIADGTGSGTVSFNKGVTTVTLSGTDGTNTATTCSFTVTVNDDQLPTITCPANINVNASLGQCCTVVNFQQMNTIIYNQSFVQGQTASSTACTTWNTFRSQLVPNPYTKVTMKGSLNTTGVSMTNPTAIAQLAQLIRTGTNGSVSDLGHTWYVTSSGQCGGCVPGVPSVEVSIDNPSYCACTSSMIMRPNWGDPNWGGLAGANCNAPSQTMILEFEINGVNGYLISDNCIGPITVTQIAGLPSGSCFPVGITTNTIQATDAAGNSSTCSFTVTVNDNQQPVITCPVTVNTNRNADAGVCTYTAVLTEFNATATDNCAVTSLTYALTGVTTGTGSTLAGVVFNKGITTVTWTATDGVTIAVVCSFTVTVLDNQQPVITCPVTVNANRNADAGVCRYTAVLTEFNATATDNCAVTSLTYALTGVTTGTGSTLAGVVFNKGITTVTWTATDGVTTAVVCSFTVTVLDNQQPVITCPVTVNANRNADAGVCRYTAVLTEFNATATDNCAVTSLTYALTGVTTGTGSTLAGVVFNKGITTVTWTAADGVTTAVVCSFTVTVLDNQQPVITCPVTVNANRNADAGVCRYTAVLTEFNATATDNCAVTSLTYALTGVTTGTGSTLAGVVFNKGITTVTWTATDGVTTAVVCSFTVTVLDNQPPVIICPIAVYTNHNTDAGLCTYKVDSTEFDATATDNCTTVSLSWTTTGATTNSGNGSMAGVDLNFGLNTITWTATDTAGNESTCSITVNVNKVSTTTTVTVTPISQQYSDKVSFVATVTPYNCTGAGTIGGKVTFKIGDLVMGEANIYANGIATLSNIPLLEDMLYDSNLNDPLNPTDGPLKPGSKTVTAYYTGTDSDYMVSNPTTPLTVTCENADVTYNGQTYFTVNPNNLSGTLVLSDYVLDRDDTPSGARGDIRNATATFWNGAINGTLLGTASTPVGLVNPLNKQEGFVTTSLNTVLSSAEASGGGRIYDVYSGLNNYYCGTDGPTPVTLALPGQDFVTGGGYIVFGNNSAGTYAGTAGKRMNFGFVMKWNPSGKNLQGKVNVIYRRMVNGVQRIYQIKGTSIGSLVVENVNNSGGTASGSAITFRRATISTKANLNDITNPLSPISLGGNLSLVMTAWESTTVNTGVLDRVGVQLSGAGSVGLLFSSNWSGGKTVWQTLNGGKIQVRNSSTSAGITAKTAEVSKPEESSLFNVKTYPNPTNHEFTLVIEGGSTEKIDVTVYDIFGRMVNHIEKSNGQPIQFGEKLPRGYYTAIVKQGVNQQTVKLIKQE
ncbi:HYR domain-containing protein [Flavobacterium sp. XS2P12]|uniref:HYR domain-containing protein n=1 Tax=Flavobacterium melibiosi TaxID=3398734 RepID=UPI003A861DA8